MKKTRIWHIVLVCYVLFIYSNSMTPAAISSQESGFVLELVHGLLDSAGISALWLTDHIIRKCAHFCEYTVLGVLLTQSLNQVQSFGRYRVLLQLFLSVFLPFVDETIQLFTPGRSGQISDVWLDMSGALCGLAAYERCAVWNCRRRLLFQGSGISHEKGRKRRLRIIWKIQGNITTGVRQF